MIGRRLLAALALLVAPFASADPGPLADLLTLFDAAYTPPDHLVAEAKDLASVSASNAAALAPSVGFEERLTSPAYDGLELSLGLEAELPLYRSRSAPAAELQMHREAALAERAAAVRATARAQFASDVLALAVVTDLAVGAGAALARFEKEVGSPPDDLAVAATLQPLERDLLSLYRGVAGLEAFAREYAAQLRDSVARAGVPTDLAPPPTFAELYRGFDLEPPTLQACLDSAPDALDAHLRHEQRLLSFAADSTPDLEVGVFAQAGYQAAWSFGPEPTGRSPSGPASGYWARVGVAANLALPDGWPLSGSAGLRASLGGAEQTLRLDWPPVARLSGPLDHAAVRTEADAELAARLDQVAADAARLLRAHRESLSALRDAELALLWLVADANPEAYVDADGLAAAWEAAERPFDDPVLELHATRLRADLAFARLALLTDLIDLQVACGTGDLGDPRTHAPPP